MAVDGEDRGLVGAVESVSVERELDWDEITRHDKPGDFWVVFRGGVYDVSEWMYRHPGGAEILIAQWGQDATTRFDAIGHSDEAWLLTDAFRVGVVSADSKPPADLGAPTMTEPGEPLVRGPGPLQAGPKLRPLPALAGSPPDTRALPEYDWEEVLSHDKPGDFWIVVRGCVYDVSEWIYHHPGGAEAFIEAYGHDATAAFDDAGHSDEARHLTRTFMVGRIRDDARPPTRVRPPSMSAHVATSYAASAHHDHDAAAPLEVPWAVRWLVPKGERFGNFDLLNDNDSQIDYFRRFGHIYAVGVPTKKWRLVVVSDPVLLDEVVSNEEQFGKRVEEINFFDQLAGTRGAGISVVGDGDYYNRVRRVMLPWYAPANQKTQFERMKSVARGMLAAWATIPDDEPLELREWMQRYALEISGRGACNYDFSLLDAEASPSPFARAVVESTKESIARVAEPRPDFTTLSGPAKRARKRAYRHNNRVLFSTAQAIVQGRQNTCPAGTQTDLLTRLLTVADPETDALLDVDTVRDQILMHLSNGFNGPSITGAWLGYVLATHPDVEERLIAEIDAIAHGDPDYDLQYTDLMALPYTTQVIKETLRVYPPMPVTIRRSLKDGMLGRYRIRRGDIILVGTLAAQRDPRYWGPHPEVFDPDQFLMEKVVERPRHAFIPFSIGQRQCMAQEVTFMMLRIALFEIYNRYRLRLATGAEVVKNTVVTTKPVAVPVVRVRRESREDREHALSARRRAADVTADGDASRSGGAWDRPSEIPETSPFRHLVIAFGSNFGTSKGLAEQFAERSRVYGYTSDVLPLDALVDMAPRTQPWLLIVMTATYTGNPPGNAIAFKTWLERSAAGSEHWRTCRYLVWGVGNSQWNAFLAFPRYVHAKLGELGAQPLARLAFGDVGSPTWENVHTAWNDRVWPMLIDLSGARPSDAAAARVAAERAARAVVVATNSDAAIARSLEGRVVAPTILTNAVGITTVEAEVTTCRELQAPESPTRTRHVEIRLPDEFAYTAGDHLGVCPQNTPDDVEQIAKRLDASLHAVFVVPKSMSARAVPKGVPLQVRNVLTCLVDITSMPTIGLLDLLIDKATAPEERERLTQIRDVLATPDGPDSTLRTTVRGGAYNSVTLLDEFASCDVNLFEFLEVAQPLRPRYYSPSSSPLVHGTLAHLTVGSHIRDVPGLPERTFRGMSSHYVHSLRPGDRINVFLDQAEGFHLQDDVTKPMVFVSAGTGYAAMRAFLWERFAAKNAGVTVGEAVLFNGIRSSALDFIYRDEIEMFVREGALDHLHVAMSREVPGQRDYVQDRITANGALVWQLVERGGFVYICGSETMRNDVRAAFVAVAAEHGKLGLPAAEEFIGALEHEERRYRPDVWG